MKTYDTVETYLEVLAGLRDVVTGKPSPTAIYSGFSPIINLARYDTGILDSMSQATAAGTPLTEKQGALACKVLLKYKRQLAAKSIDVTPIETPVWRRTLRVMDYQKLLSMDSNGLTLKFPYSTPMIEQIRAFKKDSQGTCEFDATAKVWRAGLTEYNLVWLHTWAMMNGFEVDPRVVELTQLISDVERVPYAIELSYGIDALTISNCPSSMMEYIEEKLGGFGHDNLLRLVDASAELGFTIEPNLAKALTEQYGPRFVTLATSKDILIQPDTGHEDAALKSVLDYAVLVGKTPVVIYEPGGLSRNRLLNKLHDWYTDDQVLQLRAMSSDHLNDSHHFIHTTNPLKKVDHIPMLVSAAGLLFSGPQQLMIQRAGKVVYSAADVYNNSKRKVTKIAS